MTNLVVSIPTTSGNGTTPLQWFTGIVPGTTRTSTWAKHNLFSSVPTTGGDKVNPLMWFTGVNSSTRFLIFQHRVNNSFSAQQTAAYWPVPIVASAGGTGQVMYGYGN